jgi:hypothetical protein
MADEPTGSPSSVTAISKQKEPGDHPLMSYTAVTSHQSMAEAFIDELIRVGQSIMPDHDLSTADIYSICKVALEKKPPGVVMLEGRHIRGRVSEQVSRADRYNETFSVLVIRLKDCDNFNDYDAMVDTLCERMRKTDLMFLFKARIILILPHTNSGACVKLTERILELLKDAMDPKPGVIFNSLTYPGAEGEKPKNVLDWVEDQIREF